MALTTSEIKGIARLARLRLSPEEEARYAEQLGQVVEYIDRIQQAQRALGDGGSLRQSEPPPRADVEGETLDLDVFLSNAPASLDRFLLVPQIK